MFKSTRWRSDKNKIKALFKFQFHATQIQNLDDERNNLENEICAVKMELENSKKDLKNVINDKDNEVERLKSRCNDMKQFFKENEFEKENLKKQVPQLKSDLEKKDKASCSIEVNVMKDKVKLLEDQIKLKETALECSEASFLEKEQDLKHKIEELERRLEVLDHNIKDTQISTPLNSNPSTTSVDEIKKTGANEIELLNKNKCMEIELKEMQERYSEISLKFAEVEGERQKLVLTLRNLKNTKK